MKDFRFLQGEYPEDFALHFAESLFNTARHRHLQSPTNWVSFFILNDATRKIEASFHTHIQDRRATGPYRAPWGAIEFSQSVQPEVLLDFLEFIDRSLNDQGIEEVRIKLPPLAYSANTISLVQVLLMCRGYKIELAEIGTVIQLSERNFTSIIKDSERQVLNQFHKKNFTCTQQPIEKLEEIYTFISKHHSLKGYSLSMSLEDLQKTVSAFKNNFFLFVAYDQQQIMGASVSVKVMDHVLYNFYIAHDEAYKKYSPAIGIIEALYNFCNKNSITLLDLGTSMLHGKPNFSLLDFKLRLGGVVTEKLTLRKTLV